MTKSNLHYVWLPARFWLCLVLYWLTAMIGAGMIASVDGHARESGWIVLTMVVLVSICMVTERGQWKVWQRIGLVFLAWIVQAILTIPIALVVVPLLLLGNRADFADRGVSFVATIPVVVFAMRRSRLFVRAQHHEDIMTNTTHADA